MRFVSGILLDAILLPHLNALCPASFDLFPLEIEVLKNNTIYRMEHCEIHDGRANLLCQFIIKMLCISPERLNVFGTMFPLVSLDSVEYMVQMVFFTGEIDKFPCQDSSIRCHDTANCIRVKSKVNGANTLVNSIRCCKDLSRNKLIIL